MKTIKHSSEDEMILEFLKGEYNSKRFNNDLINAINKLNLDGNVITNGNLLSNEENKSRKEIMGLFRGYPDKELFNNFPKNIDWEFVQFDAEDLDKIYYINYDYWNELSNNTSKPVEAAKNIRNGIEIYEVSNKPFIDGVNYIDDFPPVILLTCNDYKYLIIEGHSRMTVYGLHPDRFNNTYGFIGHCSKEEMSLYDSRMVG